MKFCPKCGAELKDEQAFCTKCGYLISSKSPNFNDENKETSYISEDNITEVEGGGFKFDLKTKIISCVILVLVAVCVAFYVIGSNLTKPDVVVTKFKNAVTSNNKNQLESILFCDDTRLSMDDENMSLLLKYFKNNPSSLNTIVANLNKQASSSAEIKNFQKDSSETFNVEYVGKKYIFFPEYKINMQPSFIEIKASVKNIKFKLDNKDIGESDSDDFSKKYGPLMPVEHTLIANYKGDYVSLSKSYDVNLDKANHEESVEVLKDLKYVKVDSDQPQAEIFVDNKDSGVKVEDAGKFGPITENSEIYGMVQNDGSKLRSKMCSISDNDSAYLDFQDAENQLDDAKDEVKNLTYSYINAFTQAVNSNDFSQIQSYVYPGSDLYKEQSEYIPSTYQKGIKEYNTSCNVVSVDINDDNKSGTVTTNEVYDIEDSSGQDTAKTFNYKYTFKYNDSINSYQFTSIANAQ